MALQLIYPDWPAPKNVKALSTTRDGGCRSGPWTSLNLGGNTGDDVNSVAENRAKLRELLPVEPVWLKQRHDTAIAQLDSVGYSLEADAAVSRQSGQVCAVLTADCLPLLLCERQGQAVAAVHCGWRGLSAGIIEAAVNALDFPPGQLMAWMGPAIGPDHYEVGADVFAAFSGYPSGAVAAFTPGRPGHWQLDLYELTRMKLARIGVNSVFGGGYCTYSDASRFFSYRRDGETGRQASLVWLE